MKQTCPVFSMMPCAAAVMAATAALPGAARASAQVFEWVRQLARQSQGLQRPELIDVSAPLASSASPLPAGVVFSLRAQSRAASASAGPGGPQTGGAP